GRPFARAWIRSAGLSATPSVAHTTDVSTDRAQWRTRPADDGPVRSPLFCGDLLHHFNLQIPLRHNLLEPRVLLLEQAQPLDLVRIHRAEALTPRVDRLLTQPVRLRNLCNRRLVRFTQDRNHLRFRKSTLPHDF